MKICRHVRSLAGTLTLCCVLTACGGGGGSQAPASRSTPVITWATPAAVTVGTALSSTQLDASANVAGTFTYSPAAGAVESTVASVTLSVTFTPTDTTHYTTATAEVTLQVLAATTAGPSYTWQNVQIVAGGYVTGLYFHPTQKGLMYARTDIGGAYRWSPTDSQWVPLLDWISPLTWWYGGVEAIGLDSTDPNRLYLAVGEYAAESYDGNGAILVSDDQGKTFTTVALGFKNGSNDHGRNAGERFAVDTNSPNIVYFGSRLAGLQISTDHGSTWTQASGLPVTTTANGSGVVSVVPISSSASSASATPVVYAAVAGTGVGTDPVGLYVTTRGGTAAGTWTAVAGQPSFATATPALAPLHAVLGPNGALYVLYADQPGPDSITTSQLWKFTPGSSWTSGTWTQLTIPPNSAGNTSQSGYGGLAVDPSHAGVLLLATIDNYYPGDTIYRSTNDGATWKDISATGGTHSATGAPWIADFGGTSIGSGNWVGSIVIDPFNSDHALYGTGAMIWATANLTTADSAGTVAWSVGAQGVEETSVGFVIAPPSGPTLLLSSMGDIYGFAHQTLSQSPAQGMYQNPRATASGLDFEQSTPTTVVRVTNGTTPYGAMSTDAGLTWTAFATMPAGTSTGGGPVAIAPDGSSMVWATADTSSVWYSTNSGATWTAAAGIPAQAAVVSDRVKAGVYYGYSASTLYLGSAGGATWTTAQSNLPTGGHLTVLPDAQGDVWLAAGTSGLWHNTGSATAPVLTALTSVTTAYSLGFGAPQAGSSAPALYLYGVVGTVTGLFRSLDSGSTWVQINDAAHQFGGGISDVTGDMRTFGTVYVSTNGRGIIWGLSAN